MSSMTHHDESSHHPGCEEVILGVDTHKDGHVASVVTVLGAQIADATFPTTAAGYRQLLAWARGFGVLHRAGVEGTGCYGASLTRYLRRQDITVVEVNRPDRAARRRHGKTDAVDAVAAAAPSYPNGPPPQRRPPTDQSRCCACSAWPGRLQSKPAPRRSTNSKAVIVTTDPQLRETLTGLTDAALIRHCANLPATAPVDTLTAACYTLRRLAVRIQSLSADERELQRQITAVLHAHAPQLLQRHGIGPDSASALLVTAGDNPDRLHSEASFAALCGVSPIEASSGKTRRRRLNRGGDRRANAALYRIALTRARSDQATRDYLDRRTADGKTRREAVRCLKRYIAREIYHLIGQPDPAHQALRTA